MSIEDVAFANRQLIISREDFYPNLVQRIVPLAGNEYDTSDFHVAVKLLDSELRLDLDSITKNVLSLMLTGLAQANRFGGDLHIAEHLGENSAVHSCHAAILVNELFRRAGLLSAEAQTPEVIGMRVETTLGCLIHDMGEILGEPSSMDQRVANKDLKEDPELERKIFETTLRLAFQSAYEGSEDKFYTALQNMRKRAGIGVGASGDGTSLEDLLSEHASSELPGELERQVAFFMSLYDAAELKSDSGHEASGLFRGSIIKVTEHMQGTRHLVRFALKGADYEERREFSPHSSAYPSKAVTESEFTIPISLTPSAHIYGGISYQESDLPALFTYARSPVEKKLARVACDSTWQTEIEWFSALPPLFNRVNKELDSDVNDWKEELYDPDITAVERAAIVQKLRKRFEKELAVNQATIVEIYKVPGVYSDSMERLRTIETSARIIQLFEKAIEVGYEPKPGECISLLKSELPPELQPLTPAKFMSEL